MHRSRLFQTAVAVLAALHATLAVAQTTQPFDVKIDVDLADRLGPYKPIHRFYGCDEPNYAYLPMGKRLLGELGKTSGEPVYFRTHCLFCTGDGTPTLKWGSTNLYTEDAAGNAIYDYAIFDKIFDAYLAAGVRPYFQLGFMPKAMSREPEPYQHSWKPGMPYSAIFTGWTTPPKDYAKWSELCFQVTKHCVDRYSAAEVNRWFFETWNEPNGNAKGYFRGDVNEFNKLNDFALAGVRRALPTARVGGCDTAGDGGAFMRAFLDHCLTGTNDATGTVGTPLDFVSFHAKGSPTVVNGHVRMGIAAQLKTIDTAFKTFAARPRIKPLPIIIGESDPEGCAACTGPQMAYRNGTMYSSYTAAVFPRKLDLADESGVNLEGATTWAFEFEDHPPFAGFRVLASGEIDHAVLNVFRFLGKMGGDRVRTTSDHGVALRDIIARGVREQADVSAMATMTATQTCVLVWHYHDDDVAGPDAAVTLSFRHLPANVRTARVSEYRIDATHGNAFPLWQSMGSPQQPTTAQLAALKAAAANTSLRADVAIEVTDGAATTTMALPRQGVSLIVLDWTIGSDRGRP